MSPTFHQNLRRWLARLAFSFIIIGGVLLWEGYKALGTPTTERRPGRALLCFIGGGACMALAAHGMRERHRRRDPNEPM